MVLTMQIIDVADHRDVRAPRLPSLSQLATAYGARRTLSVLALAGIDAGSLVLAAVLVTGATGMGWLSLWPDFHTSDLLIGCAVVLVTALGFGLYGRRIIRHSPRAIVSAWTAAFVVALAVMLLVDPHDIGARYVLAWMLAGTLSLCGRYVFDATLSLLYGEHSDAPPALLFGTLEQCRAAMPSLAALAPRDCVKVVGLVVPASEAGQEPGDGDTPPVIASQDELGAALASSGATQLILAEAATLNGHFRGILQACQDAGVALKLVSVDIHPFTSAIGYVPGMDCPLYVVRPRPAGAGSYLVKALGDRVAAAAGLVVLGPVLLVVAVLIKATSRGPVVFVDERVGVGQSTFRLYKFRTMVAGAQDDQHTLEEMNEAGEVLFKIRDDPRVTGVGRLLRRFSIDELPQLVNVLKGDMSLVGPRPLPLRDYARMAEPDRRRHVMHPGITGLWQVSGRSDLSFDDMVRLDEQYMESWSLKTDAQIVWRTVGVVLTRRGAY